MQDAMRKRHPTNKHSPQSDQIGDSCAWRAASARLPSPRLPWPRLSPPSHPSIPPSLHLSLPHSPSILLLTLIDPLLTLIDPLLTLIDPLLT